MSFWQTPDFNKNSKFQQKKSRCLYIRGVVWLQQCCLVIATGNNCLILLSFFFHAITSLPQTRSGRDKGTTEQRDKGTKGQMGKGTKGHNFNVTRNLWGQQKPSNFSGQKKSRNLLGHFFYSWKLLENMHIFMLQ